MLHDNTIEYIWEISEFEFKEKKKNWFWLVGLGSVILMIISVLMTNFLLTFLILIGTVLMFTQANKAPITMDVEISNHGIKIHHIMHEYPTIQSFWIKKREDGNHVLILMTSQRMTALQSIAIPSNINPLELREFLLKYIDEQELRESYTDKLINTIGF